MSHFAASRARELCERQQVAAVCYRISPRGPEFLLVRTRGGRWIFPKGGVEPGLTHAQSAALEAFEEAGVHGRIEEMPFARYRHSKPSDDFHRLPRRAKRKPVIAHLCEVSHLDRPQEAKRKPTWFSPEKAKKRLLEERDQEFGNELASIIDRAVLRIRHLETSCTPSGKDELQHVTLEARETSRLVEERAALIRYFLREGRAAFSSRVEVIRRSPVVTSTRKILQLHPVKPAERAPLRLTAGSPIVDPARNIAASDRKGMSPSTNSPNSSSRKRRS